MTQIIKLDRRNPLRTLGLLAMELRFAVQDFGDPKDKRHLDEKVIETLSELENQAELDELIRVLDDKINAEKAELDKQREMIFEVMDEIVNRANVVQGSFR